MRVLNIDTNQIVELPRIIIKGVDKTMDVYDNVNFPFESYQEDENVHYLKDHEINFWTNWATQQQEIYIEIEELENLCNENEDVRNYVESVLNDKTIEQYIFQDDEFCEADEQNSLAIERLVELTEWSL